MKSVAAVTKCGSKHESVISSNSFKDYAGVSKRFGV